MLLQPSSLILVLLFLSTCTILTDASLRIVGGTTVDDSSRQYPYYVYYEYGLDGTAYFCAGSLM